MPKITINEQDLTRSVAVVGTDIPYIPGFLGYTKKDSNGDHDLITTPKATTPILYTTLTAFQEDVGYDPYCFETDVSVDGNTIVESGMCDPSYIMASELLRQGMPVYYHAFTVNGTGNTAKHLNIITANSVDYSGLTLDLSQIYTLIPNSDKEISFTVYANSAITEGTKLEVNFEGKTISIDKVSYDEDTEEYIVDAGGIAANDELSVTITYEEVTPVFFKDFKIEKIETTSSTGDIIGTFYTELKNYLDSNDLADCGEYTVKYLTCGGYPNVGNDTLDSIFTKMVAIAAARGDCVALAEYIFDKESQLTGTSGFRYYLESKIANFNSEYAAAFYPSANHTTIGAYNDLREHLLPASYSYLISLAKSIKTNPNWLAIAGVGRGYVGSINKLNLDARLSNTVADDYQPTKGKDIGGNIAVNAITYIRPYGYTIWGNRTMKKIEKDQNLMATHFLNTRNILSDIKKTCYSAARSLMFEQNSTMLWLDFTGKVTPLLDKIQAGHGIASYKIIKSDVKSDGTPTTSEELACVIRIQPISAVEVFDINVLVTDSEVNVD